MPVNAAILIGGTATAIGTSTNILVLSIAGDMGVDSIGVFTFTRTVALAALVAIPYLWLIMPRLLPTSEAGAAVSPRPYQAFLHVTDNLVEGGRPLEWFLKRIGKTVTVIGVTRGHRAIAVDDPGVMLFPGDRVQVSGNMTDLHEASALLKAPLAKPKFIDAVRGEAERRKTDRQMAELVVGPDSPLIGETLSRARLPERFGVVVLGTYRANTPLLTSVRYPLEERFQAGDLLLVHGTAEGLAAIEEGEKLMLLGSARDLPEPRKAPVAVTIVVSVILIAALRIVPIAISALAGSIAMLVTRCVQFGRIGRALSSEVIVVVAASIALGRALVETGAAAWMGALFASAAGTMHPAAVLVAVMAFATVMTNFVSNAAAAAVGTPLAISIASELSMPAEPMVLAVLFGANLCYVTPVAYQTNLLIMAPGGYRFSDYVRAGLPLALIMISTLAFLLVRQYGL
jgi:di/tricarboxylate transporter